LTLAVNNFIIDETILLKAMKRTVRKVEDVQREMPWLEASSPGFAEDRLEAV
jgi:hypothetical protein